MCTNFASDCFEILSIRVGKDFFVCFSGNIVNYCYNLKITVVNVIF